MIVKRDFMCTQCCYLWTYYEICVHRQYFSSSLVLTAVQQERQILMWSTELAVYGPGCEQKSKFRAIWLGKWRIAPILDNTWKWQSMWVQLDNLTKYDATWPPSPKKAYFHLKTIKFNFLQNFPGFDFRFFSWVLTHEDQLYTLKEFLIQIWPGVHVPQAPWHQIQFHFS